MIIISYKMKMEERIIKMIIEITDEEEIKENLDINLFETGLIDSLGFTELLVSIEENFGIELAPTEIKREMVDTPNKIIDLIKSRSES